jgi:tetratricopeptide (TPR) repeat protein
MVLGELALGNKDAERALAYVEKVLAPMEHYHQTHYRGDLYCVKGKALLRIGRGLEGIQVLENARQAAETTGARRSLWMVLQVLIEVYQQQGDLERAADARRQAEDLARFFFRQVEDPALRGKFLEKFKLSEDDLLA